MLILILLIVSILLSGCVDITDSYKPGSFGATEEEAEMIDVMTEKYGDMTQDGDPRLLEVMMTSSIINFIPVDTVLKYSKDSDNLYVWFVYDNFNNDILNIEWTYLDEDYLIHTFESETGEDFGRGSFILEKPDDGWPIGRYEVKIMGAGVSESVKFEIINGPTESIPLEISSDKVDSISSSETSTTKPGWYLIESNDFDTVLVGNDVYIFELDFKRGNVIGTTTGGTKLKPVFFSVKTIWNEPPSFIEEGGPISIKVEKDRLTLKTTNFKWKDTTWANIDKASIGLSYATSSGYDLKDSILRSSLQISDNGEENAVATFTGIAPKKNSFNGKFGLRVKTIPPVSVPYGTEYVYEWRE